MITHPETQRRYLVLLATALGPLAPYLGESDVVEVIVGDSQMVLVERQGHPLTATGESMTANQLAHLIAIVAGLNGTVCTREQPTLSAVLPGSGARLQASIPPASPVPSCTIRRPPSVVYRLDDYVASGSLAPGHAEALRQGVAGKQNIVIAGETGSGKTTLVNSLLALMRDERIVTLEDTRELQCPSPHRQSVYTTPPNRGMTELLKEALRHRPDRIILGECRGAEAIDLLDAWNTGHPGGVTTVHAGDPAGTLTRLESLLRHVSPSHPHPMPLDVARPLIASAVNLIACLTRTPQGRRLAALVRVHGMQGREYHLERIAA